MLLIRHAESVGNAERRLQGQGDFPLSERGVEQAEQLAARLTGPERPSALYSSPLLRTRQTAAAISAVAGLPVRLLPDVCEYDFGEASGLTWTEIAERYPDLIAAVRSRTAEYPRYPGRRTRGVPRAGLQCPLAAARGPQRRASCGRDTRWARRGRLPGGAWAPVPPAGSLCRLELLDHYVGIHERQGGTSRDKRHLPSAGLSAGDVRTGRFRCIAKTGLARPPSPRPCSSAQSTTGSIRFRRTIADSCAGPVRLAVSRSSP